MRTALGTPPVPATPAAGAPPASPRLTAGVRREEILRAAITEFAAGGLAGTSTEAIAGRAGVSQPYLFRLYGTKKALFLAAVRSVAERIHETFRSAAAAAAAAGTDPFEAMGSAYVELLADREQLLLQMHSYAACGDADVREMVRTNFGELWDWLRGLPDSRPDLVQSFMAMGMLLNVAAAQDLLSIAGTRGWALECVSPPHWLSTDGADGVPTATAEAGAEPAESSADDPR